MSGKRKTIGIFLLIAYLGAVVYCCFGHFSDLPEINSDSLFGIPADKVVHFLMFFPFPILCHLAFAGWTTKTSHTVLSVSVIFLTGAVIAAATEIGQSFTDYRSGDILDFTADTISLAVSSMIVLLIDLHIKKHQKRICSKEP